MKQIFTVLLSVNSLHADSPHDSSSLKCYVKLEELYIIIFNFYICSD